MEAVIMNHGGSQLQIQIELPMAMISTMQLQMSLLAHAFYI